MFIDQAKLINNTFFLYNSSCTPNTGVRIGGMNIRAQDKKLLGDLLNLALQRIPVSHVVL